MMFWGPMGSSDQAKVSKGFPSAVAALDVGSNGSTGADKLVDLPLSEPTSTSNGKGLVLVQEVTPSVGNLVGMVPEEPPGADATSGLVSNVSRQVELKVPPSSEDNPSVDVVSLTKSVGEELVDMLRCNNLMGPNLFSPLDALDSDLSGELRDSGFWRGGLSFLGRWSFSTVGCQ